MSLADDVREFQQCVYSISGIAARSTPGVPSEYRIRERIRFIAEEFFEMLDASFIGHPKFIDAREALDAAIAQAGIDVDLPEFADALGDLDYLIEGTRQEFGIDGLPIAKAIHAANMRKFPNGVAPIIDGKIQKPADWQPPDIAAELRAQGWADGLIEAADKAHIVDGLIYFGKQHVGNLTHSANTWSWRVWADKRRKHIEYSESGYTNEDEAKRNALVFAIMVHQ